MSQLIPAWVDGDLKAMDKLQVHLQALRHKAVSVFVMCDDRLLIQRRALVKYHTPGLWANTCCTHPEWEETAPDCAVRRVEQELGITGLDLQHKGVLEYRADVGGGMVEDEVVDVFLAHTGPDLRIVPNPEEVMDHRWVRLADLDAEIAEAMEDLSGVADEGVTWRLSEAARAADKALRAGQEDKTEYETAENGVRLNRGERAAFDALLSRIGGSKSDV